MSLKTLVQFILTLGVVIAMYFWNTQTEVEKADLKESVLQYIPFVSEETEEVPNETEVVLEETEEVLEETKEVVTESVSYTVEPETSSLFPYGKNQSVTDEGLYIHHEIEYVEDEIAIYEQMTGQKYDVKFAISEFDIVSKPSPMYYEVRHQISGCHYIYIIDTSLNMLFEPNGTKPYCSNS